MFWTNISLAISDAIELKGRAWWNVSVRKQLAFLEQLPQPDDDFIRSHNQYLCQQYFIPYYIKCGQNIASFFLIIVLLMYWWFKPKAKRLLLYKAVFSESWVSRLPDEIKEKYGDSLFLEGRGEGYCLDKKDVNFIFYVIRRYPFSLFFTFKLLLKIANYSYWIRVHKPETIITCSEYSFTSSILTYYCECKNVIHVNIQHGEKLLYIRDSFFRFHRFYIWDSHYKKVLVKMKAYENQFMISLPSALKIKGHDVFVKYKYILALYSEAEILEISNVMKQLFEKGYSVCLRPHPHYSDMNLLRKYVPLEWIEDPTEIGIEQSIAETECLIGSYSTVLLQGYLCGKKIILDDVVYKSIYKRLKEHYYILSDRGCECLSEILA